MKSTRVLLHQVPMHLSDLAYKLSMGKLLPDQPRRAYVVNQRTVLQPENEILMISTCQSSISKLTEGPTVTIW